ncbi:MAG: hypothetical protein ACRCS6_12400 [Turicibacter sp.]
MKYNRKDAFIKLNSHKRMKLNDTEFSTETNAFAKAEVSRIKEKIQRKQLEQQENS